MEEFLDIVNIWIPESLSTNICYLAADFVRRLFGVEVRCYFRGSVVCEFNTRDAFAKSAAKSSLHRGTSAFKPRASTNGKDDPSSIIPVDLPDNKILESRLHYSCQLSLNDKPITTALRKSRLVSYS